jgi:hypothetical protein
MGEFLLVVDVTNLETEPESGCDSVRDLSRSPANYPPRIFLVNKIESLISGVFRYWTKRRGKSNPWTSYLSHRSSTVGIEGGDFLCLVLMAASLVAQSSSGGLGAKETTV